MQKDNQSNENLKNEEFVNDMIDFEFVESDEEGNTLPAKDVTKKMREEIKKLRIERDEYLVGWQRAKADYVNLQKESAERQLKTREVVVEDVINDLLPVLDSFDMAMSNKESWQKVDANWRAGIEYIYQQFIKTLENYNVSKVGNTDEIFDPQLHEAVENITTENIEQDHKIANVIQSGYKIGERIIRPARVKVYIK